MFSFNVGLRFTNLKGSSKGRCDARDIFGMDRVHEFLRTSMQAIKLRLLVRLPFFGFYRDGNGRFVEFFEKR